MTTALLLTLALTAGPDAVEPAPAPARQVAGVAVPEALTLHGQRLTLNGAGLRRKMVFDVYVAALYLPARCADEAAILAADAPWEVVLTFRRDVGHEKILESFKKSFALNSPGELDHLRAALEGLDAILPDLKEGQVLDLSYLPGVGTSLVVPGGRSVTVPGRAFGEAMLRTWLGEHPSDQGLKAALLGR